MTTSALTLPEQALRRQLADEALTIDLVASLYGENSSRVGTCIREECAAGRIVARREESSHPIPTLAASFTAGSDSLRLPKPKTFSITAFHIRPEDYTTALQNGLADLLPEAPAAVLAWLGEAANAVLKKGMGPIVSRKVLLEQAALHAWSDAPSDLSNVHKKNGFEVARAGRNGWFINVAFAIAESKGKVRGKPWVPGAVRLRKVA